MIIDQLPEISTVQETDEIPVERGTTTYKTTLQKIKSLIASLLTKSDVGLGSVDNVRQYSAQNPPPYPVTSVNGETGAVTTPQNDSGTGYCKMPDGTLIQWGRIVVNNVPITNAWGAVYESSIQSSGVVFPITFVETPCVVAFANVSPTAWLENIGSDATRLGSYYLVRPTTSNASSGYISWMAIGRWK